MCASNCWLHASNTAHRSYHNTCASPLPAAQQDQGIPWCGHAGCVHTTYHRMRRTFSCARATPLAFHVSALQLRPFECASCHTKRSEYKKAFPQSASQVLAVYIQHSSLQCVQHLRSLTAGGAT